MDILIRLAEEKDISLIAEIERECFTTPETENTVREVVGSPVYEAYVSELDGEVVGHTITMSICGEEDILSVAVRPSFRRLGIGKMLMDNIIARAVANENTDIFLEVRKSNVAAISLYERCGFEKVGERKNFYDLPREDAVLMKKSL